MQFCFLTSFSVTLFSVTLYLCTFVVSRRGLILMENLSPDVVNEWLCPLNTNRVTMI